MGEVCRNEKESANDMALSSEAIGMSEDNTRSDENGKHKEDSSEDVALLYNVCPISPILPRFELEGFHRVSEQSSGMCGGLKVVTDENNDDEDCIILDCDTDKSAKVVDVEKDDDLFIVGEKGEVACRDFPHPRHLCAKYPFQSTPHQLHCAQCYCFVCDSRAPCPHWGTGNSTSHHCHATDKDEHWTAERLRARESGRKPLPTVLAPEINEEDNEDARLIEALLCTPEVPTLGLSLPLGAYPPPGFPVQQHSRSSIFNRNSCIAAARGPRSLGSSSISNLPSFKRPGLVGISPNNNNHNSLGLESPLASALLDSSMLVEPSQLGTGMAIGCPYLPFRAGPYSVGMAALLSLMPPQPRAGNFLPGPGAIFRPAGNFGGSPASPFQQPSAGGGLGNWLQPPSVPFLASSFGPGQGFGNHAGLWMGGVSGLGQGSQGRRGVIMSSREFGAAWVRSFLNRGGFPSATSSSNGTISRFSDATFNGRDIHRQR